MTSKRRRPGRMSQADAVTNPTLVRRAAIDALADAHIEIQRLKAQVAAHKRHAAECVALMTEDQLGILLAQYDKRKRDTEG